MFARGILAFLVVGGALVVPHQNRLADPDMSLPQESKVLAQSQQPVQFAPRHERSAFLSPNVDSPYPFKVVMGSNPERICDRLDEAGFANLDWRPSEVAGVWECMAQVDEAAVSDAANHNNIFYLLRGEASRRITYARLKINVPDLDTSAETLSQAQDFMRVFATAANFTLPPDLLEAIAVRKPVNIVLEGITFRLKPEFDDPDRLNLSIEFGPALNAFHRLAKASGLPSPAVDAATTAAMTNAKGARLRKPD